jgi:hypothetical protein
MSHLLIAWIAGSVGFLLGGLWFAMWDSRDKATARDISNAENQRHQQAPVKSTHAAEAMASRRRADNRSQRFRARAAGQASAALLR